MKNYRVEMTADVPYPFTITELIKATSYSPAVSRALKKARQGKFKGKKIRHMIIKVFQV